MTIQLSIGGMRCEKCVDKIEKFVGEIDGIDLIDVDLQSQILKVNFSHPATLESIKEAILDAGFEIKSEA